MCSFDLIERVQRRFTKRLSGLSNLTYSDRLLKLNNVDTLELRRLKLDLVMMFKIYYKLVDMDFSQFFCLNNYTSTRGHSLKLLKPVCNNNARQFSFSCRRIDAWNALPPAAVLASSVAVFKNCIHHVNFNKFLKYNS
mgnify:FL=1